MQAVKERLSSLSPLIQGYQVNYIPMMAFALQHQGRSEEEIFSLINQGINVLGVGDLGEKFYPKSAFDEQYIHQTSFYMSVLQKKTFDLVFSELFTTDSDLGKSLDFACLVRIYYALKSEDTLEIAQALSFAKLSTKKTKEVFEEKDLEVEKEKAIEALYQEPTIGHVLRVIHLHVLEALRPYLPNIRYLVGKYMKLSAFLEKKDQVLDINKKPMEIKNEEDILLLIYHDFIT